MLDFTKFCVVCVYFEASRKVSPDPFTSLTEPFSSTTSVTKTKLGAVTVHL